MGPYRATIEDHVDTCADYLGRLRHSLDGEIAPDRHYFADKAHRGLLRSRQCSGAGQKPEPNGAVHQQSGDYFAANLFPNPVNG